VLVLPLELVSSIVGGDPELGFANTMGAFEIVAEELLFVVVVVSPRRLA